MGCTLFVFFHLRLTFLFSFSVFSPFLNPCFTSGFRLAQRKVRRTLARQPCPPAPAGGREWECTKIRVARPVPGFRLFPIFCLPFSLPFFHLIPALMHLFFSFLLPFFCFFLNRAVWAASIGTVLLILYEYESGLRSGVHGVVRFVHSGFEVCCDCQ